MYARRQGGRELTFDFAEGLDKDNLLIADRETDSVWSQLAGAAIFGEMTGTPLQAMPAMQTTWAFWRQRHPDTRVSVLEGTEGRGYIYSEFEPGVTPRRRDGEHDTATVGLGIAAGDEAWFFPFPELQQVETPVEITIGDQPVRVFFDAAGITAWAEDADGTLLMGVVAYERGWRSFHPESQRWQH